MRRKRAVGWAYGLTWGRQGIQAVTMLILAAILGPDEFGVMALGLIYIGFIEMILQQGFVAAIIQRRVLRQSHVSSVFWLMVGLSILLMTLGVLLSGNWAALNNAPALNTVIFALSLTIPLVALRMVPTALLTRHFKMKALTVRSVGAALVASSVAIPLALAGFGVWSLVAQHLFYAGTSTVLVWSAARWRPRFELRWSAARALLSFSLRNFGAKAGSFFTSQMDAIVIGLFWGPTAVGLYRLAARCISMALEFLSGALQFVSFPEFSKLQDNRERLQDSFLGYIRFATLVTWPALAILAVLAVYIPSVLGLQWVGVEYALVALAICGAIQTLTQFLAPLLQSVGRPGTLAGILWFQGALGAVVFAAVGSFSSGAGLPLQTASIAVAKGIIFIFLPLPVLLYFSRRLLDLPVRRVFGLILPAGLCACLIYLVGWTVREGVYALGLSQIAQLLLLLVTLGLAWIVSITLLSVDIRRFALVFVKRYSSSFPLRFLS